MISRRKYSLRCPQCKSWNVGIPKDDGEWDTKVWCVDCDHEVTWYDAWQEASDSFQYSIDHIVVSVIKEYKIPEELINKESIRQLYTICHSVLSGEDKNVVG